MPFETSAADSPNLPFVSVIIPVYEPDDSLVSLARCLAGQTYPANRLELLLVDDGSSGQQTGAVFEAALRVLPDTVSARLLRQPNRGSYSARNTGIAAAGGDLVIFTDADCLPQPVWIAGMVAALLSGEDDLVAGAIAMMRSDETSVTEWYDSLLGLPQQWFAQSVGFGATANLGVTRACLDVVQGFDATLRSGGDQEFCDRAQRSGFHLGYSASAPVVHSARIGIEELARKTRRVAMGRADAYPSVRYLLPQGFGALVRQRNPVLAASVPARLQWRLRMLHVRLEWIRVIAYARRVLENRLARRD
jgi:glycosyltransferase involved in cell wall biosynthesis